MAQPRVNPAQFLGPFLGLATTLSPHQLAMGQASVARNVILSDGRIRPRPPWLPVKTQIGTPVKLDGPAVSMFRFYPYAPGEPPRDAALRQPNYLVKTTGETSASLWLVRDAALPIQLLINMRPGPCQFVQFGGPVYILDGGRPWRFDTVGFTVRSVGLDPTVATNWSVGVYDAAPAIYAMEGSYSYRISRYDPVTNIESNAVDVGAKVSVTTNHHGIRVQLNQSEPQTPYESFSIYRIYRQQHTIANGNGSGSIWWRLVGEIATGPGPVTFLDTKHEDDPTLPSDEVNGPWAPSRNGIPPSSRLAAPFAGRMLYADAEARPRIYFSAVGSPDYVHPDDFIDFSGDEDERISGLKAHGGQFVVGKPRAVHVLAGVISAHTNDTVATGSVPPEPTHASRRTRCTLGPMYAPPTGFIEAGQPSRLLFAHESGLYEFNGDEALALSEANKPLWEEFVSNFDPLSDFPLRISFAIDEANGLLILLSDNAGQVIGPLGGGQGSVPAETIRNPIMLCYHYRANGAMSRFDAGDQLVRMALEDVPVSPSCVGGSGSDRVGNPPPPMAQTPKSGLVGFAVGTYHGLLLVSDDDPAGDVQTDVETPDWQWDTGDLSLVKGMQTHLHALRVLTTPPLRQLPDAPAVRVTVVTDDRHSQKVDREMQVNGLMHSPNIGVGLTGRTFRFSLRRSPTQKRGYDRGFGIIGWSPDVSLSGQR